MRVLVCVKRVPAPGARINVTDDGMDVDAAHLGFTTSPHEECGVEAALQLTERHGGEVTVLTVGPVEATEQLRYAASVGADRGVLVATDGTAWDPQRTATAIVDAVRTLEAPEGRGGSSGADTTDPFDLIVFGNESADSGGFQVGIRVAHALGRPIVQGIKSIEVSGDGSGEGTVTARREVDGGFEVYELPRPCAVGVKEGLNLPRYPTMKGRLASKKLEIETLDRDITPGGPNRRRLRRPTETVSDTVMLGDGPDAAVAVVDIIDELGLL